MPHLLSDVRRNRLFAVLTEPMLEDAILTVLRHHNPTLVKLDGWAIRLTLARALVRFLLERTRGNQSRAAELTGISRETMRRLIQFFGIDWKSLTGQ